MGRLAVNFNSAELAERHAERACELLAEEPDSFEKAWVTLVLARVRAFLRNPACWDEMVAGAGMAERIGSRELQARAAMMMSQEQLERDDPSGIQTAERALELARQLNSSTAVLVKFNVLGDLLALGHVPEARDLHAETWRQAKDLQLATYSVVLEQQSTMFAFITGEWERAWTGTKSAPTTPDRAAFASGNVWGDEVLTAVRSALNLTEGAVEDALRDTDVALALIGAAPYQVPLVAALSAFVLASLGASERALHVVNQWNTMLDEHNIYSTGLAWPLVAQAACRVGRGQDFVVRTNIPRVQTAWIDCARAVAKGQRDVAIAQLKDMDAGGIARLLTESGPPRRAHRRKDAGRASK